MVRQKKSPLHVTIYPSNFNGKNGNRMLYVSSNTHDEITINELDALCHEYESLPKGYVSRCFDALIHIIPQLIGEHKRVHTPLGSFYIKPQLVRTMTDDEKVISSDISLSGIDFRPTKAFREAVESQFQSIEIDRRKHAMSVEYYSQRNESLENCLSADKCGNRFVTIEEYRRETGLSYKTSKKCLDIMTEGDNPILRKTRIGHTNVYTEV